MSEWLILSMYDMRVRDSRVWIWVSYDNWIEPQPPSPPAPSSSSLLLLESQNLSFFTFGETIRMHRVSSARKGDWLRWHLRPGIAENKHLSFCHLFTSASFIKISLTFHTKFNLIDGRGRATPTHWLTLPYDRRLLFFQLTWNLRFTQLCLPREQAAKIEIRLVLFVHWNYRQSEQERRYDHKWSAQLIFSPISRAHFQCLFTIDISHRPLQHHFPQSPQSGWRIHYHLQQIKALNSSLLTDVNDGVGSHRTALQYPKRKAYYQQFHLRFSPKPRIHTILRCQLIPNEWEKYVKGSQIHLWLTKKCGGAEGKRYNVRNTVREYGGIRKEKDRSPVGG